MTRDKSLKEKCGGVEWGWSSFSQAGLRASGSLVPEPRYL